ncbi:MAG: carboxypeptidase-like regulatory domain-containing protein [Bacteroidales bacterium]|nr:carboxypeptidase-like regulatory domain-containing protein [Bacteroidales bacterium]
MKALLLSILIISGIHNNPVENSPSDANAYTISGIVVDKLTGEALTGVMIEIEGMDKLVYTDFDGKFELNGLPKGEVKISSSLISYKTIEDYIINVNEKSSGEKALVVELELMK